MAKRIHPGPCMHASANMQSTRLHWLLLSIAFTLVLIRLKLSSFQTSGFSQDDRLCESGLFPLVRVDAIRLNGTVMWVRLKFSVHDIIMQNMSGAISMICNWFYWNLSWMNISPPPCSRWWSQHQCMANYTIGYRNTFLVRGRDSYQKVCVCVCVCVCVWGGGGGGGGGVHWECVPAHEHHIASYKVVISYTFHAL